MSDSGREDSADAQALSLYLHESSHKPPLTPEEETALLRLGRAGDHVALRRVIESHLLQAATIAIATSPPGVDPLDAIQRANTLLISFVEDQSVAEPGRALPVAIRSMWDSG